MLYFDLFWGGSADDKRRFEDIFVHDRASMTKYLGMPASVTKYFGMSASSQDEDGVGYSSNTPPGSAEAHFSRSLRAAVLLSGTRWLVLHCKATPALACEGEHHHFPEGWTSLRNPAMIKTGFIQTVTCVRTGLVLPPKWLPLTAVLEWEPTGVK